MKALGLSSSQIILQPHNSEWTLLFEEEAEHLRAALGDFALDIQHVGSTSIPGIPAKPILDIAIVVADFEEAKRFIAPIESLGYIYRGEQGILRRHYFVKGTSEARTHHLHVNEIHGSEWRQQIAFRDALRADPALAQEAVMSCGSMYPDDYVPQSVFKDRGNWTMGVFAPTERKAIRNGRRE